MVTENLKPLSTAFFHDEKCLWHSTSGLFSLFLPVGMWVQPPAGAGLAESPDSKRRIVSLLQVSSLASKLDFLSAPMATEEDLLRVHPQSYLEQFKALSDDKGGEIGMFAPFGRGSYEIAKLSAGLALHAVDSVISGRHQNAYVMSRPPGHHCLADEPMGFCLFANIAIAIESALAKHDISRVVVLDWDVHHGNGTQAIYYERDDVLTISLHQEGCFPPGYSGTEDRGAGKKVKAITSMYPYYLVEDTMLICMQCNALWFRRLNDLSQVSVVHAQGASDQTPDNSPPNRQLEQRTMQRYTQAACGRSST